ncbi:MAG: hypothetical protein LBT74_02780, partial [Acidobacteriota bacterium]|nr:hypothetical protein [Acidobacteriota bacterium]
DAPIARRACGIGTFVLLLCCFSLRIDSSGSHYLVSKDLDNLLLCAGLQSRRQLDCLLILQEQAYSRLSSASCQATKIIFLKNIGKKIRGLLSKNRQHR